MKIKFILVLNGKLLTLLATSCSPNGKPIGEIIPLHRSRTVDNIFENKDCVSPFPCF